jgi:hypothetical protein
VSRDHGYMADTRPFKIVVGRWVRGALDSFDSSDIPCLNIESDRYEIRSDNGATGSLSRTMYAS